jgi:DNA-directed RNA polymerase subunit RPC12/RpoP
MTDDPNERRMPKVECPRCGALNEFGKAICSRCSSDLALSTEIIVARLSEEQRVVDSDGSTRPITTGDLSIWAEEAKRAGVCVVCAKNLRRLGDVLTFPCSFCGGLICNSCMSGRRVEIRDPLLRHMIRFGLTQFHGYEEDYRGYYSGMRLQAGYYLCKNCMYFLNGPEFIRHARQYYERTGRLEELAELQELQGQLDDAKRTRQAARSHPHPNLKSLIDKLREEGLAVPYRCPSCGANITIDSETNAEGLRFCSYCGTAVNMDALVRVIEASLRF